jgi:putative tryptophan/tyrosine transport system substrate-binding protein
MTARRAAASIGMGTTARGARALVVVLVAAYVVPLTSVSAVAQAPRSARLPRVGVLSVESAEPLRRSLRALGYVDGGNVVFEIRDSADTADRMPEAASELVRLKVDVIVATNPSAVFSARAATRTIPIVMVHTPDPVALGLVTSLARPGGNVTGTTSLSADMSVKQLEILKEMVPRVARLAVLANPDNPWHGVTVKRLRKEQRSLGVDLQIVEARRPDDFEVVFQSLTRSRAGAILILAIP